MNKKIGKSYLNEVPHGEGTLTFQYPAFKGTYGKVAGLIDSEGLKRPTSPEVASLVYDAWKNPKGEAESEILKILKDNWFWEFTGNFYLPKSNEEIKNGVILVQNPEITNGKLSMNKSSLIKRLNENDPAVKFVPFGYKTESQTSQELEKNPYIIARYGEEGAEKIAEISRKYNFNPYLFSFKSVDKETQRMSALFNNWNGNRLNVNGDSWFDGNDGHSFGVSVAD
ncbi:hypothetical protein COU58_04480 [Candidatus Pacearchaeota archaeon CG10_big_fil_rev_8_21_14_0_10_32_42]|nr:MAG: hypothetical protein COU58_04480 [Candidatus Pacearchaeota archaeon CG10_big_fil_rev_8_21_14_0_10_32_42]